jgi:hypothetical protein
LGEQKSRNKGERRGGREGRARIQTTEYEGIEKGAGRSSVREAGKSAAADKKRKKATKKAQGFRAYQRAISE